MSKHQSRIDHWSLVIEIWSLRFGHSLVIGIWVLGFLGFVTAANADENAVLHLTNGGFVPGELKGSEQPSVLRWQSQSFTRPFEFSLNGVSAVHYSVPAKLPKPQRQKWPGWRSPRLQQARPPPRTNPLTRPVPRPRARPSHPPLRQSHRPSRPSPHCA